MIQYIAYFGAVFVALKLVSANLYFKKGHTKLVNVFMPNKYKKYNSIVEVYATNKKEFLITIIGFILFIFLTGSPLLASLLVIVLSVLFIYVSYMKENK